MTPVLGRPASGTPESEYNKAHTTMRNVVERCIGVLKSRFRCLLHYRTLLYNPDKAATVIAACAALHNIAMASREPVPEGDDDDSEAPPAADEPPSPPERGPAPRLLHLKGQQQRSRVVNLFRGPRTPHAAHLRRVRSRLQRPRQRCVVRVSLCSLC